MTFGRSVSTCPKKYADFNGRASRSEYWWFALFTGLVSTAAGLAGGMVDGIDQANLWRALTNVAFGLPSIAASTRRLHDIGKSGWNILWAFTIIGLIPLTIWYCTTGSKESNKYGYPIDLDD